MGARPLLGIQRHGLVSFALVLWIGGVRRAQVSGTAPSHDAALAQAIAEANRWL